MGLYCIYETLLTKTSVKMTKWFLKWYLFCICYSKFDIDSLLGIRNYNDFFIVLLELIQKKSLTKEQLLRECNDNLFLELSNQIPHCGLTLTLCLGLTRCDAEKIKRDNENENERIIATLLKWRERNGSDATYLTLVKIFMKCKNRELAEFILDYVIKNVHLTKKQTSGRYKYNDIIIS